ncbi:MAG: NAD(P)H-dependent oxidoreductase [Nocardioidaceae bacterium]|nr:NAD(P)H-dependent oxidoreductase [Nocardioidaceae bacterium]
MRILTIAGSLRRESFNRRLLQVATDQAEAGIWMKLWEGLREVPVFDEDAEAERAPAAVAELREALRAADAVLIATPEYNGSIPGALKNALDWASRPYAANTLRDKPVAVIGASPSPGGAKGAQDDLRKVLRVIGADVVDVGLAVASVYRRFDDHLGDPDEPLRHQLREVVHRLATDAATHSLPMAG